MSSRRVEAEFVFGRHWAAELSAANFPLTGATAIVAEAVPASKRFKDLIFFPFDQSL